MITTNSHTYQSRPNTCNPPTHSLTPPPFSGDAASGSGTESGAGASDGASANGHGHDAANASANDGRHCRKKEERSSLSLSMHESR